jgi:tetratricopeptide (TPR) repeat protein
VIVSNLKQPEEALKYFHAAIKINERPEINDQKGIGIANGGLGDCHYALEDYDQAENHYKVNLNISRNNGDKQGIVRMTSMLGGIKLLNAKNEQDTDTKENLLYEAEEYYNNSLMVAEDQKGSISILCALSGLLETIILSESFNKCIYVFEKIDKNADIIVQGLDWAKDRLNKSMEKLKVKTDDQFKKEIENYYNIINHTQS